MKLYRTIQSIILSNEYVLEIYQELSKFYVWKKKSLCNSQLHSTFTVYLLLLNTTIKYKKMEDKAPLIQPIYSSYPPQQNYNPPPPQQNYPQQNYSQQNYPQYAPQYQQQQVVYAAPLGIMAHSCYLHPHFAATNKCYCM